jgi:hypothetical protein
MTSQMQMMVDGSAWWKVSFGYHFCCSVVVSGKLMKRWVNADNWTGGHDPLRRSLNAVGVGSSGQIDSQLVLSRANSSLNELMGMMGTQWRCAPGHWLISCSWDKFRAISCSLPLTCKVQNCRKWLNRSLSFQLVVVVVCELIRLIAV